MKWLREWLKTKPEDKWLSDDDPPSVRYAHNVLAYGPSIALVLFIAILTSLSDPSVEAIAHFLGTPDSVTRYWSRGLQDFQYLGSIGEHKLAMRYLIVAAVAVILVVTVSFVGGVVLVATVLRGGRPIERPSLGRLVRRIVATIVVVWVGTGVFLMDTNLFSAAHGPARFPTNDFVNLYFVMPTGMLGIAISAWTIGLAKGLAKTLDLRAPLARTE